MSEEQQPAPPPVPQRDPYGQPPMSGPTRAFHAALIRLAKGAIKAYESWLSQQ